MGNWSVVIGAVCSCMSDKRYPAISDAHSEWREVQCRQNYLWFITDHETQILNFQTFSNVSHLLTTACLSKTKLCENNEKYRML